MCNRARENVRTENVLRGFIQKGGGGRGCAWLDLRSAGQCTHPGTCTACVPKTGVSKVGGGGAY